MIHQTALAEEVHRPGVAVRAPGKVLLHADDAAQATGKVESSDVSDHSPAPAGTAAPGVNFRVSLLWTNLHRLC